MDPAGGLVIVDEAGQCDTRTLAAVCGKAAQVRARVVLVGDEAQQGSISAGGLFAALTDTGALLTTVALGELWRFDDPAEAAATVELRRGCRRGDGAGDGDGLTFYRDRGRVSFSSHTDVAGLAQAWWAARRDRQVIISCATTALMNNVNTTIAAARHRAGETGAVITGSGDNIVRVGDVITTRRNNRDLIDTTGSWVRNGDRWITVGVAGDGDVILQRTTPTTNPTRPDLYGAGGGAGGGGDRRGSVVVGEDYFADHVELGYAITTTRAQSVSTDASLTVIDAGTSLPELYVGLTRGAGDNHLIVVADELAFDDDHPDAAGTAPQSMPPAGAYPRRWRPIISLWWPPPPTTTGYRPWPVLMSPPSSPKTPKPEPKRVLKAESTATTTGSRPLSATGWRPATKTPPTTTPTPTTTTSTTTASMSP